MRFLLSSSQKNQKTETKIRSNKKTPPVSTRGSKSVPPSSSRSASAKKKETKVTKTVKKVEIKKTIIKKKSRKVNLEPEVVTTKSETAPAKEVDKCLLCQWIFPNSFRGEEKNVHMARCMEEQGEEDKKFWNRCQGDLKAYQYNFDENQSVRSVSRKPKERSAPRSPKRKEEKKREESPKEKKVKKKKRDEMSIEGSPKKDKKEKKPKKEKKNKKTEKDETKKDGKRKRKDEEYNNSEFEPAVNIKKVKIEEGALATEVILPTKKKQTYTKILMLPVVKQLIFDPSKEFRKKSRKKDSPKS